MKKQYKQLITLGVLCVLWAISAHYNKLPLQPPSVIKTKAAKSVGDTVLMARFHRIRSKMDALYHYRIKPVPFDPTSDPFQTLKAKVDVGSRAGPAPGSAEGILKQALANMRIGGVMTRNGVIQLTVDGGSSTRKAMSLRSRS